MQKGQPRRKSSVVEGGVGAWGVHFSTLTSLPLWVLPAFPRMQGRRSAPVSESHPRSLPFPIAGGPESTAPVQGCWESAYLGENAVWGRGNRPAWRRTPG